MRKILWHKYELMEVLGGGACSQVFLARDLHLNRLVAVKQESLAEERKENEMDDKRRRRIAGEMELLKELEHPGLPQILDFFEENGSRYLVMEYIEGLSLRHLLAAGAIPLEKALFWAVELCEILQYLHSQKPPVIYRDLKPENIIIRPDNRVYLVDLGTAFQDYGAGEEMCAGTPGYSPKEQWMGRKVGTEVDIYGLGAVLHEMVTGVCPLTPSYVRRSIREYDRTLPERLDRLIWDCTAQNPEERPRSMEEVAYALLHCREKASFGKLKYRAGEILSAFLFIWGLGAALLPFIKGVPADQLPFPYLKRPLVILFLFLSVRFLTLFCGRFKRPPIRRRERSIWFTEKKYAGLYLLWAVCLLGTGMLLWSGPMVQGAEDKRMWVEMRDEQGRKLLLKEGACYQAKNSVRLEIPAERLPKETVALQLTAVGESGSIYSSRIFYVAPAGAIPGITPLTCRREDLFGKAGKEP